VGLGTGRGAGCGADAVTGGGAYETVGVALVSGLEPGETTHAVRAAHLGPGEPTPIF